MSKRTDREFLSDILEAIHRIQSYTVGMSFDAFLERYYVIWRSSARRQRGCQMRYAIGTRLSPGEIWQGFGIG